MMDLLNTQQFIRQPTYYGTDATGATIPATAGEVGAGFDFGSI
jgi:hypothetical protein